MISAFAVGHDDTLRLGLFDLYVRRAALGHGLGPEDEEKDHDEQDGDDGPRECLGGIFIHLIWVIF
jgi:hypothetical protein